MKRALFKTSRLMAAVLSLSLLLTACGAQPAYEPEPQPEPMEEVVVMPAPEHYFGMSASEVDGDTYMFKNLPESPWNALACYVRLLTDEYGLVPDTILGGGSDFYFASLLLPGNSDFKTNLQCSIFEDGTYTMVTWFYGPVRFEDLEVAPNPAPTMIVPSEGALPAEAPAFPIAMQGPMLYLGHDSVVESVEMETRDSGTIRYDYTLSMAFEKCQEMMQYYIDAHLLEELGLTQTEVDDRVETDGIYRTFYTCPGAEGYVTSSGEQQEDAILLLYTKQTDNLTGVSLICSPSFVVEEMAPTEPAAAPEQTEPTPVPSADPSVLPDFLKTGTDYEVSNSTTTYLRVYTADHMDISAVETYVQILQDMGYTIVHTETDSNPWGGMYRLWEFAHSGLDAETISTHGAHVTVESSTYGKWNDQTLDIEFSSSITMDGISISGGSSGSSSSSSSSNSSGSSSSGKSERKCYKCSGDGDITCTNCNGRGGKEVRESVPNYSGSTSGPKYSTTWENCYKCHGSGEITCTNCGGDGKY